MPNPFLYPCHFHYFPINSTHHSFQIDVHPIVFIFPSFNFLAFFYSMSIPCLHPRHSHHFPINTTDHSFPILVNPILFSFPSFFFHISFVVCPSRFFTLIIPIILPSTRPITPFLSRSIPSCFPTHHFLRVCPPLFLHPRHPLSFSSIPRHFPSLLPSHHTSQARRLPVIESCWPKD